MDPLGSMYDDDLFDQMMLSAAGFPGYDLSTNDIPQGSPHGNFYGDTLSPTFTFFETGTYLSGQEKQPSFSDDENDCDSQETQSQPFPTDLDQFSGVTIPQNNFIETPSVDPLPETARLSPRERPLFRASQSDENLSAAGWDTLTSSLNGVLRSAFVSDLVGFLKELVPSLGSLFIRHPKLERSIAFLAIACALYDDKHIFFDGAVLLRSVISSLVSLSVEYVTCSSVLEFKGFERVMVFPNMEKNIINHVHDLQKKNIQTGPLAAYPEFLKDPSFP